MLPWQRQLVETLFGTVRPDGTRQYRVCFVAVPRKNGKSSLAAAIALYLLVGDGEQGAEVYSAAADRDQAAIVFDTAKAMVEASPLLRRHVRPYRRLLEVPRTGSIYRVLSSDVPTKHGLNPHGVIFDELHAQPNRELWDVLTTGVGARRQPLVFAMSTAGYDRSSICWEIWEYARAVRDGQVDDPTFLPVLYEAPEDARWDDRELWARVNPSLGVTVSLEYLEQQARWAERSPGLQNTFRRLHLNQWVSSESRWIDLALWDACPQARPLEQLAGAECYGGLDLSSTTDLTAWALMFPADDGSVDLYVRYWCPEARLHGHQDAQLYAAWARQGWLQVIPGRAIEYEPVVAQILEDARRFRLASLNIDAQFQGRHVGQELERHGLRVFAMPQGGSAYGPVCLEFVRLLEAGLLRHDRNPVLRWQVDAAVARQDWAGRLRPDRAKSTRPIDGLVASLMALDRVMRREKSEPGVWVL